MASGLVGVADDGVPVGHGQLAGDERRGAFGAVLDHLDEVSPLGVAQRHEHPGRRFCLRTLTEITLLCAERPKPQKTGSAWMHLATLYRSRS